jgi:hypothetical protein
MFVYHRKKIKLLPLIGEKSTQIEALQKSRRILRRIAEGKVSFCMRISLSLKKREG